MSIFGLTKTIVCQKIKKFPESHRETLRGLSFGSAEGSLWRWTYHDGSTYAAVMYGGASMKPEDIMAWGCLTYQEEPHPVVGLYTKKEYRGHGLGEQLLRHLLSQVALSSEGQPYEDNALTSSQTYRVSKVYAVAANYPRYPEILESMGFEYLEWE